MPTAITLPYPDPANSGEYAADLDTALGAPDTGANLEVTSAWVQAESPTFPGYNGLGTELDLPGAVRDPSNPAVYDYDSLSEGLMAAVDMMLGEGPQRTPLETSFVTDLRTGQASEASLIADIRSGGWAGSGPDDYDANAIQSKLASPSFSVVGSAADTTEPQGSATVAPSGVITNAELTGFDWNPLSWPGQIAGSAVSSLAGSVGIYILKGVLTLMGVGLILYGGVVMSGRHAKGSPAASSGAPPTIPGVTGQPAKAEEAGKEFVDLGGGEFF